MAKTFLPGTRREVVALACALVAVAALTVMLTMISSHNSYWPEVGHSANGVIVRKYYSPNTRSDSCNKVCSTGGNIGGGSGYVCKDSSTAPVAIFQSIQIPNPIGWILAMDTSKNCSYRHQWGNLPGGALSGLQLCVCYST